MIDLIFSVLAICIWGLLIGLTIYSLLEIVKYLRKIAQFIGAIARAITNAKCFMVTTNFTKTEKKDLNRVFTYADTDSIFCEEGNKNE